MFRRISAAALALATVLLLAGCITIQLPGSSNSSGSNPQPSSATSSSTPDQGSTSEVFTPGAPAGQCLSANLSTQIEAESSSMGHFHYSISFTNNGSQACNLQGFPTVQVDKAGVALGSPAEEDSSATGSVISLAPGASISAQLSGTNIEPDGGPIGDLCAIDHGDGLRITPPHSLVATVVPAANFPACANPVSWMTIEPLAND